MVENLIYLKDLNAFKKHDYAKGMRQVKNCIAWYLKQNNKKPIPIEFFIWIKFIMTYFASYQDGLAEKFGRQLYLQRDNRFGSFIFCFNGDSMYYGETCCFIFNKAHDGVEWSRIADLTYCDINKIFEKLFKRGFLKKKYQN